MSNKTELFISKAKLIHGNKFDYSKVEYVNIQHKVIIICQIHGEFLQTPSNHLSGNGCESCRSENCVGGNYSLDKLGELSNIEGYYYDIILYDPQTNESFGKIGITKNFNNRFSGYGRYKLKYIIELEKMSMDLALLKEQKDLRCETKYRPLHKFGGHTECYR